MATEASEAMAAMILERQAARQASHSKRVEAAEKRRSFKEMLTERRAHGLRKRHAAKLARNYEQGRLV
jgi:hypothetical protein